MNLIEEANKLLWDSRPENIPKSQWASTYGLPYSWAKKPILYIDNDGQLLSFTGKHHIDESKLVSMATDNGYGAEARDIVEERQRIYRQENWEQVEGNRKAAWSLSRELYRLAGVEDSNVVDENVVWNGGDGEPQSSGGLESIEECGIVEMVPLWANYESMYRGIGNAGRIGPKGRTGIVGRYWDLVKEEEYVDRSTYIDLTNIQHWNAILDSILVANQTILGNAAANAAGKADTDALLPDYAAPCPLGDMGIWDPFSNLELDWEYPNSDIITNAARLVGWIANRYLSEKYRYVISAKIAGYTNRKIADHIGCRSEYVSTIWTRQIPQKLVEAINLMNDEITTLTDYPVFWYKCKQCGCEYPNTEYWWGGHQSKCRRCRQIKQKEKRMVNAYKE